MAALSVSDRIAVLDSLGGAGLDVFKSISGVSQQTMNDLYGAIRAFEQSGHGVGFMMIDLTTGAGVSYSPDRKFYSASTIKGPYVAAVNEQRPWLLSGYSNSMWSTINYSDNNGYAHLRSSIGPDPIGNLVNETHAYGFTRPALAWKNCAVYAKSGWMYGGMQVHNEACLVVDGDRPYVMTVMSQENIGNSWKMANLMNAIDRVHGEIIR